jgi:predicted permease
MRFDLVYAIRQLTKNPGFTAVALVTLALGIGINATAFTLVNVALYRMPPYPHPDQLVSVYSTTAQAQFSQLAPANARDVVSQATVFEQATPWCWEYRGLAQPGKPANRVIGLTVAGNFFSTLGVTPMLGRALTPADDAPGHGDVIVASESFWRGKLGGDPAVVGSIVRIDGLPVTVVGIASTASQDFVGFGPVDFYQPLAYGEDNWRIRDNDWMHFVARLRPGVSLAEARAQLDTIAARLAHDHPETNARRGLALFPYAAGRAVGVAPILWTVLGLMLFVLLIACVNLANLQLARTMTRVREYAIRIALGASRGQLVRQLLAESVLLSVAGGALGLLVAVWGNRLLGSRIQLTSDATGLDMPLDHRVLAFTFVAAVLTGIIFGLVPALMASRTDVNAAVKQGSRGAVGSRSRHRLRRILVVAELALALASLGGAAYFVRGIQRLATADAGWQTANLVTGSFVLPTSKYSNEEKTRVVVDRIRAALAGLPGVDRVAVSGSLPFGGIFSHAGKFLIEGQAPPAQGLEPLALAERVTPGYFPTIGVRLLEGRDFTEADRQDARHVAIINTAMAAKFWPGGDAVGHRIGGTDPKSPDWKEIVGVVSDIQTLGNVAPTPYQMYRPFAQDTDHWLTFTVHTTGAIGGLPEEARRAVGGVDSDLAVYQLGSAQAIGDQYNANLYLIEHMLTIAAVLGLLLALVGIYGVIANLAVQRTQEIGVRMALGAGTGAVLWLVMRDGVRLGFVGTGIGLVLAFGLSRGLSAVIPGVPGSDNALMVGLAALLVAATLLACLVPALRSTHVDPVEALRAE